MSPDLLIILALGACAGGGVVLLIAALRGVETAQDRPPGRSRIDLAAWGARVPWAVAAGLGVLVFTRWPVMAAAVAALVYFGPAMFGGRAAERRAVDRLEGLAAWTESLRDTIAGAVGLEQAIPATAYAANPSVQRELTMLADRLRVRMPLPVALQRFADDLDDPSADLIIAALMLNSRLRGPGLRDVLTSLAHSAREELEMRRRVSAGRASTRRSVQIVMGITVGFVSFMVIFNREYLEPYNSPFGQMVLAAVLTLFALGFLWLRRLSVFDLPERFMFDSATGAREGARR